MTSHAVKIVEAGATPFELDAALLLYRGPYGQVYVTAHEAYDHPSGDGRKLLGPGKPASKNALADFAAALSDATAYSGMVPANVVYTGPNVLGWWCPPAKRRIWFKCDQEGIGNVSAEIYHPGLVFVATPGSWYVFAAGERPEADMPLFKAPYMNVWESGEICSGNVDLPARVGPEAIRAYENAFFRSRFTHTNDDRLVRYKGGAYALWRDQLRTPDFPLLTRDVMRPRKETFEQAITRILGKATR